LNSVDEAPNTGRRMSKNRMEAFSDGVFAIAITLLVLDLALRPPGSALHQFLEGWPAYLAYIVSFLTIGAAWIDHNALTDRLGRVDTMFLRLNLIFLLFVVFLPYPTRLVSRSLHEHLAPEEVATVVYGITLLLIQLMFRALEAYSRREQLRLPGADDPDLSDERRKFRYVVAGYVLTIDMAVVLPQVSVALYCAIAIYLVVPFRAVRDLIAGRQPV
jgi:uncharacterized membrane protein